MISKTGFSKLSTNCSAAKTSWCSQIYNLWTEKKQKLSSLRYLISRNPYHTLIKCAHPVSKSETGFLVIFTLHDDL